MARLENSEIASVGPPRGLGLLLSRPLGGAREVGRQGGGQRDSGRDRDDGVHRRSVGGLWKSRRGCPFNRTHFMLCTKLWQCQYLKDRKSEVEDARPQACGR